MTAAMLAAGAALPPAGLAATDPCAAPVDNQVACENSRPGTPPNDWQTANGGDPSIQGFSTRMSVTAGQTVTFKIKTPARSYHLDILRLGYYGGDGARKVTAGVQPTATLPQTQPACLTDASTGLIDCGNWAASASWTVPAGAVSGVYVAHLVRDDTGADSQIPFVVRDDARHSDMLVATSDATWAAYNAYGGNSLYTCSVACPAGDPSGYKAAYAVSYNRPFDGTMSVDGGRSYLYYAEYQMIRFLEQNGYDVSYASSGDLDADGASLINHRMLVSSGHDEYWSAAMRANVEAARDAGVSLAFFSGNEMFWKTRFAPSGDGTATPRRTIVSYKETHFESPVDPAGPSTWTGTWRDPRWSPPGDGGRPENALTGQFFLVNSGTSDITVPAQYAPLRFWRNTAVANLTGSQSLTLSPGTGTLGYEWDTDPDNGFRPAGQIRLSSTTVTGAETFTDFGTSVVGGSTATHHLTLHRAPSGALVFGAGTVQWAWGLDTTNAWFNALTTPSDNPPNPNIRQATVNLFADMGAQPSTLSAGLAPAARSADATAPSSQITSPAPGAALPDGRQITISGTATDAGGGVVAGVEVSTDDGASWHPASGSAGWSYSWTPHGNPRATIRTRATDDSGNIERPSAGVTVDIGCPCSLFGDAVPATPDAGDVSSLELGVKFKADVDGAVTGIRFYKAAANTGTHVGSLWTAGGTRLASATFTSESTSGWQEVRFPAPVDVTAGTTYVASYLAPRGHYSSSPGFFYRPTPTGGSSFDSPPLHAIGADGQGSGGGNGLYGYAIASTFPTNSFRGDNYGVDVSFTPASPPGAVSGVGATAGAGSARVSWTAPANGGAPTSYRVTPYVDGVAQAPRTVTGTPPATAVTVSALTPGTAYRFTVRAVNGVGSGPESAPTVAVTPTDSTAPAAPTDVTATTANHALDVSWSAPSDDGGSPITAFTVTPYAGTTAGTPVAAGAQATSVRVTGLTNGTAYTFRVRATNVIGTGPTSSPSAPVAPQAMLFDSATPAVPDAGDGSAVELGVRFVSDEDAEVTGVRFYKAAANTGVHRGSLWTATGTLLASATFSGETASGWQQVRFSRPVSISARTTYVASYFAPAGHYSVTAGGLQTAVDVPPLHALGAGTAANGVFAYGLTGGFPAASYNASNYWVDVMAGPPSPPDPASAVSATAGPGAATVSWSPADTGGTPSSYRITPYAGGVAQTAKTVTGSPPPTGATVGDLTPGQPYTFTVRAANATGASAESAASAAVTPTDPTRPAAPANVAATPGSGTARVTWDEPAADGGRTIGSYTVTPYAGAEAGTPLRVDAPASGATVAGLANGTAYRFAVQATNAVGDSDESAHSGAVTPQATILESRVPPVIDSGDGNGVELGVKFTADAPGTITGIRFYKAVANAGTHVGSLWTAAGTLLASATFTAETPSGWQQATFSTPVAIAPDTTYVASYHAPLGHYSLTPDGLATAIDTPPLHALADRASANGTYAYGATSSFPTRSYNAGNYWVDAVYEGPAAPGMPRSVTAVAGSGSVTVSWSPPGTGGTPTSYRVTPRADGADLAARTVTGSPPATSTTISGLTPGRSYTFTVQAVNAQGSGPESPPAGPAVPSGATAPGAPRAVTAVAQTGAADVSWSEPADDGGSAVSGYTVTPHDGATAGTPVAVGGATTATTVGGLRNGTAYTFTVRAANAVGAGPDSAASAPVTPHLTILGATTPSLVDAGDANPVELGVKFTADVAGTITGVRFYKAPANTGAHVVSLWTASGTLLATATATGETASGWQQAGFAAPVAIDAATTYVAGYFAPAGHYSATPRGFAAAIDSGPLHAVSDATTPNGVYGYGPGPAFPLSSWNATDYAVDVMYLAGA